MPSKSKKNKPMKHLSFADALAIGFSWFGAAMIAYAAQNPFVAVVCVILAYDAHNRVIYK